MTYTVMGKCAETGAIGIGIATASANCSKVLPNIKGLLPTLEPDGAIVCSQSMVNPTLGYKALDLLDQDKSFDEIEHAFALDDEHIAYRQVGIVKASGDAWAYTGETCFPEKGHFVGADYLVMGNCLGAHTLAGMQEAYEAGEGLDLGERLLRTLEAGRGASGPYPEDETSPPLFCSLSLSD